MPKLGDYFKNNFWQWVTIRWRGKFYSIVMPWLARVLQNHIDDHSVFHGIQPCLTVTTVGAAMNRSDRGDWNLCYLFGCGV
jgi:hypothetical protein